jgi:hypothetical protein
MSYLYIIYNIVTSSFVVGIATYFIQKRIDKRFKEIEEFQKTLITIRKERYDTLLKTLQEIWEKIVETEFYIQFELVEQIKAAQKAHQKELIFDSTPLKSTYIFIQKRSILLTENLSTETKTFFEEYLLGTYNGYIDMYRQTIAKQKTLEDLNKFIPERLGVQYKMNLNQLKKKFEEQARQILYDENKSGA